MQLRSEIFEWLHKELTRPFILEAWIFGSFAKPDARHSDVDVYVKYCKKYSISIIPYRRKLEIAFSKKFGVPLHLLVLNEIESAEEDSFLRKALFLASRVV